MPRCRRKPRYARRFGVLTTRITSEMQILKWLRYRHNISSNLFRRMHFAARGIWFEMHFQSYFFPSRLEWVESKAVQTEQEIEKASSQISSKKKKKKQPCTRKEEDVKREKGSVLDDLSVGCFWDGDFHSSANYCLQIRDETGRGITLQSRQRQLASFAGRWGTEGECSKEERVCFACVYQEENVLTRTFPEENKRSCLFWSA